MIKHNEKVYRLPTEKEKKWCKEHNFSYYIGTEEVDCGCYQPSDFIYTEEREYTIFFDNTIKHYETYNKNYSGEGCGFILLLFIITLVFIWIR